MKLFVVPQGAEGRLMSPAGYKNWTVRKELTFEREDLVLDPVLIHNQPEAWSAHWPDLDSVDQILFSGYAREGFSIFHRDGHYLATLNVKVMS